MKRILGIALAVLLVLVTVSAALAGSRPVITQDPVSATTNAKGSVSFSVKVNTNGSNCTYTWYFVNPATGEKTSGRNLTKLFKKIKVVGPNRTKITLNRVPEEMHGWSVYCHVNGNGYKLDSQMATLSIYGMEAPATPTPEPTPEPTAEPTQEPAQESEVTPKPEK